jgi:hypothetical protein
MALRLKMQRNRLGTAVQLDYVLPTVQNRPNEGRIQES